MHEPYPGPLRAVVFDWAGTIVDHGSRAPMGVFVKAFAQFGLELSIAEARSAMGLPKRDHIQALGRLPRIQTAWHKAHGRPFSEVDVDAIYDVFVPMNAAVVADYAEPIPGALETIAELRRRGLRIGSTTGYTRAIMAMLAPRAAALGYAPDCLVCADDVAQGRPAPLMMYRCFLDLAVWPAAACVKVDDTPPGIAEGLAAGCWTVGVAVSGNAFGMSAQETAALSASAYQARRSQAVAELTGAGAHFVIDSVRDLAPVIDAIEARLRQGIGP